MPLSDIARSFVFIFIVLLSSCSNSTSYIEDVHEFNLTRTNYKSLPVGLSRSQTAYFLYGEISTKRLSDKLGQYYTIHWEDQDPTSPVDIVFDYQRAGHGSQIFTQTVHYDAGRSGGEVTTSISFTGEDYTKSGRAMTWKATLIQNGQEVSRRTSYLWEDPQ